MTDAFFLLDATNAIRSRTDELVQEIYRLREQLRLAHADAINEATENAKLRAELAESRVKHKHLYALLNDAYEHLEWIGYGDSWERECAVEDKLPERLQNAIAAAREDA